MVAVVVVGSGIALQTSPPCWGHSMEVVASGGTTFGGPLATGLGPLLPSVVFLTHAECEELLGHGLLSR